MEFMSHYRGGRREGQAQVDYSFDGKTRGFNGNNSHRY